MSRCVRHPGLVTLSLLLSCAARQPVATDAPNAIELQQERAAELGPDQVLEQVRLASMARNRGDDALAEDALRRAVAGMTTFQADGEFAAIVGAEQSKDWKGEPYEKLAAYTELGLLLHGKGDRGNALAMYKSAALADTGTREERFRSDYVPAWVLQALAFQAEGEQGNAEQSMQRAIDAQWSRQLIELLTGALVGVSAAGDKADVDCARALLLSALSGGASAAPRDPVAAVAAAGSIATELRLEQMQLGKKERLAALAVFKTRDFEGAVGPMADLLRGWSEAAAALPLAATARERGFDSDMQSLLLNPPNVVLVLERGQGPRKMRTGRYGEQLTYAAGRSPADPQVRIGGLPVTASWMDSLSWQATTRGGRRVDHFLDGKAVFKDTSFISGYVLLELAEAAAHSDAPPQVAAAFAVAGCCLIAGGAVTNPQADIRQWEGIPEDYWLVAGTWPPGVHDLRVDGQERRIVVPTRGQLVAAIPARPGAGKAVLGDTTGIDPALLDLGRPLPGMRLVPPDDPTPPADPAMPLAIPLNGG
jgi:hypothetical protein